MVTKKMPGGDLPQTESKHPPRWTPDLSPNRMAGQNIGVDPATPEKPLLHASDVKELTRALQDFTFDELKEIGIVPDGARLEQGATYVDLDDPLRRAFTAPGNMIAEPGHHYVPKAEVPFTYWNRLVRVPEPERKQ